MVIYNKKLADSFSLKKTKTLSEKELQNLATQAKIYLKSEGITARLQAVRQMLEVLIHYDVYLQNGKKVKPYHYEIRSLLSHHIMVLSKTLSDLDDDMSFEEYHKNEEHNKLILVEIKLVLSTIIEGVFKHNLSIFAHDEFIFDLSGINLQKQDIEEIDLRRVNMTNAKLYRANLHKSQLQFSSFQNADLVEANISDSILTEARLINANLSRANLSRSSFEQAYMSGADLTEVDFTNASISFSIFKQATLFNTDLYSIAASDGFLQGVVHKVFKLDLHIGVTIMSYRYLRDGIIEIQFKMNSTNRIYTFKYNLSSQEFISVEDYEEHINEPRHWLVRFKYEIDTKLKLVEQYKHVTIGWAREFKNYDHTPDESELKDIYYGSKTYDYGYNVRRRLKLFNSIKANDIIVIPHPSSNKKVMICHVEKSAVGLNHAVPQKKGQNVNIGLAIKVKHNGWVNRFNFPIPKHLNTDIWDRCTRTICNFNRIEPVIRNYVRILRDYEHVKIGKLNKKDKEHKNSEEFNLNISETTQDGVKINHLPTPDEFKSDSPELPTQVKIDPRQAIEQAFQKSKEIALANKIKAEELSKASQQPNNNVLSNVLDKEQNNVQAKAEPVPELKETAKTETKPAKNSEIKDSKTTAPKPSTKAKKDDSTPELNFEITNQDELQATTELESKAESKATTEITAIDEATATAEFKVTTKPKSKNKPELKTETKIEPKPKPTTTAEIKSTTKPKKEQTTEEQEPLEIPKVAITPKLKPKANSKRKSKTETKTKPNSESKNKSTSTDENQAEHKSETPNKGKKQSKRLSKKQSKKSD